MKKLFVLFTVLCCGVAVWAQDDEYSRDECTSLVVGRLASADGSVITSHTCDGVSRTWITVEPAADYGRKQMMDIYKNTRKTAFRGDTTGVRFAGQIPQARHTYAYLNTAYPCMNEKQVAMGETTFSGPDTLRNGGSMFLIEELARVALQRCDNARDAIRMMGSLAEKYGYADGGECLTVIDKKEAWFFEILGCGRGKVGAVWAAQRVPDDEVAVSANIPRIGKIDRANKDYFMASDNVEAVALEYGLWDGQGDFVFWKAYHSSYGDGKNFKEREYVILNTLAPSLKLSYDAPELPFSVKPDAKVDVRKVMEVLRGTYEGLEFDMTKNLLVEVPPGAFDVGEGSAGLDYDRAGGGFALELQEDSYTLCIAYGSCSINDRIAAESTAVGNIFPEAYYEIAAVACRLSPTLVYAVYGIVSAYFFLESVDLDVSLPLIAVRIHYKACGTILGISETEDGTSGTAGHLGKYAGVLQEYRII